MECAKGVNLTKKGVNLNTTFLNSYIYMYGSNWNNKFESSNINF
jgi:hypothetical protein